MIPPAIRAQTDALISQGVITNALLQQLVANTTGNTVIGVTHPPPKAVNGRYVGNAYKIRRWL